METSELLLLCLSSGGVSVGLRCLTLTHGADSLLAPPRPSPVCRVLLCSLILAVDWILTSFLPPTPQTSSFSSPSLLLCINFSLSSLHLCLLTLPLPPITCIAPTPPLSRQLNAPAGSLLRCGGPQKRTGQMVSDDFRALLISTGNSLVLLLLA